MKVVNKKFLQIAGAFLFSGMLCCSVNGFAQDKTDKTTKTVKGEVLDMACYMDHGAHGAEHAKCAQMCLKKGSPVGLLGADGQVYLLVEDHSAPDPYSKVREMGAEEVTGTGYYNNRNGVQALVVEAVK